MMRRKWEQRGKVLFQATSWSTYPCEAHFYTTVYEWGAFQCLVVLERGAEHISFTMNTADCHRWLDAHCNITLSGDDAQALPPASDAGQQAQS